MLREVRTLLVFSLCLLGLMYALFFLRIFDPIVSVGYIFGSMAVVSWWVSYILHVRWKQKTPTERSNNMAFSELRWYFLILGAFFTADLFPHALLIIAGLDVRILTISHWAAHTFLFLALIMAARIAMTIFHPHAKNTATAFVALMALAALGFSATHPDQLINIPSSAYPLIVGDIKFTHVYTIVSSLSAGLFGLYLIIKGAISPAPTRNRAILLGIGFVGQVLAGAAVGYIGSAYKPLYIYTFLMIWTIPCAISAFNIAHNTGQPATALS